MGIICVTDKLYQNKKSFVWPNYYVLEKFLWKQKSWCIWKLQVSKLQGDNQVWWVDFLRFILEEEEKL